MKLSGRLKRGDDRPGLMDAEEAEAVGAGVLDRSDHTLDEHVRAIHLIVVRGEMATMLDLGAYLLRHFYGGSEEAFRSRARQHASLDRLACRTDLGISRSVLYSSVVASLVARQLPDATLQRLTVGHLRILDSVRDPETRRDLAQVVVQERLSSVALRARLTETRGAPGEGIRHSPGRPSLPHEVKVINGLRAIIRTLNTQPVGSGAITRLSSVELIRLASAVDERVRDLVVLREILARLAKDRSDS